MFCLSLSFVLLFCVVPSKNVACHKKENHRIEHRCRSHKPVIQASLTQTGDFAVLTRLMSAWDKFSWSPIKPDVFLLQSHFCVLRAWLGTREGILSDFLPASGYKLSGLCSEVASH